MDFYVYLHKRKSDGSVFYVGKGSGRRAWSLSRNVFWKRTVAKHGYIVEIVQGGMQEWWAHEMEIELIAFYGRENLCNLTDGGEGAAGYQHTESHKIKMKDLKTGEKRPRWIIEKLISSNTGRSLSEDHRLKLSLINQGHTRNKGRKHSEKTKKLMSSQRKGRTFSEETRAKLSAAQNKTKISCSNGMIFESITSAAKWLVSQGNVKASRSGIRLALKNLRNSAYGFQWSYFDSKKLSA